MAMSVETAMTAMIVATMITAVVVAMITTVVRISEAEGDDWRVISGPVDRRIWIGWCI
jgi:hypothetical protein